MLNNTISNDWSKLRDPNKNIKKWKLKQFGHGILFVICKRSCRSNLVF